MKTNTARYEASHGRKPKGAGAWALLLTFTDGRGAYSSEVVHASGTLTAAKAAAKRQIVGEIGRPVVFVELEVLP